MKVKPTKYDRPFNCPVCKVSLLMEPIPKKWKHMYKGLWFKREIGVYDVDLDRTVYYRCPDCKGRWRNNADKTIQIIRETIQNKRRKK